MEPALAGLVLYQPVVSTTGTWPQNIGDDPGTNPGQVNTRPTAEKSLKSAVFSAQIIDIITPRGHN